MGETKQMKATAEEYQKKLRKLLAAHEGKIKDSSRDGLIKCSKLIREAIETCTGNKNRAKVSPFLLQPDVIDQLVADINSQSECPTNKPLLEVALWRRVRRVADGLTGEATEEETEKEEEKEDSTKVPSFNDYLKGVYTDAFGTELDKLGDEEEGGFDARKVTMLLDCLENAGVCYGDAERQLVTGLSNRSFKRPRPGRGGKKNKEKKSNSNSSSNSNSNSTTVPTKEENSKSAKKRKKEEVQQEEAEAEVTKSSKKKKKEKKRSCSRRRGRSRNSQEKEKEG